MNDATTIHQLTESNKTLHERLKQLNIQRDAYRDLCVECKEFIDQFVDNSPEGEDKPFTKQANFLDAALESALAIHR